MSERNSTRPPPSLRIVADQAAEHRQRLAELREEAAALALEVERVVRVIATSEWERAMAESAAAKKRKRLVRPLLLAAFLRREESGPPDGRRPTVLQTAFSRGGCIILAGLGSRPEAGFGPRTCCWPGGHR
jgi:hypothetical protein